MEAHDRIFPFDGSDLDYIRYLESRLLNAERLLSSSSNSDSSQASKPRRGHPNFINLSDKSFPKIAKQKKALKPQTGRSQWEKDLKKLLSSVPPPDKWNDAREKAGFATIEKNRLAIQLLLGRPSRSISEIEHYDGKDAPLLPGDDIDLFLKGCQYGMFVSRCEVDGQFAIRIASYQQLVFVSYCTVLISAGNSHESINWMMRQFISNSDDRNLEKYRSGCVWVNRCIFELLQHRWGYKSWETFMLCRFKGSDMDAIADSCLVAQPLHQYARLAEQRRSFDIFVKSMGDGQETGIFEEGWVPYCIPCIIKFIAGDKLE